MKVRAIGSGVRVRVGLGFKVIVIRLGVNARVILSQE